MIRFIIALILLSFISFGITYLLVSGGVIAHWPSFTHESLALLIISVGVLYRYLNRVDKAEQFISLYLLSMVVKLLAYGAYSFFMIARDESGAAYNLVFFLANYFVFTALEIGFLYQKTTGKKSH